MTDTSKSKVLSGIAKVRSEISALDDRKSLIDSAYLDKESAIVRAHRDVRKKGERSKSVPVAEWTRVRTHDSGDPYIAPVEIPEAALWDAIVPLACAAFEDRINKLYDRLEFEDGAVFMSMAERRKALAEIKAERTRLEVIEGALIRKAYAEGHEPLVRPEMDVRNLFPLTPDPAWQKPKTFSELRGGSAASFAHHQAN